MTEFTFDQKDHDEGLEVLREVRKIYLRNGASNWHLYADFRKPNRFQMEVLAPSWVDYQRMRERFTMDEKNALDKLHGYHRDSDEPEKFVRVSLDKYVIGKHRPDRQNL